MGEIIKGIRVEYRNQTFAMSRQTVYHALSSCRMPTWNDLSLRVEIAICSSSRNLSAMLPCAMNRNQPKRHASEFQPTVRV